MKAAAALAIIASLVMSTVAMVRSFDKPRSTEHWDAKARGIAEAAHDVADSNRRRLFDIDIEMREIRASRVTPSSGPSAARDSLGYDHRHGELGSLRNEVNGLQGEVDQVKIRLTGCDCY